MRWLIAEDALRDRRGHWFEYVRSMRDGLVRLGDEVTVLADHQADSFIIEQLDARPVLPPSIWHRMNDGTGLLRRLLRIPWHAWETYRRTRRFLRLQNNYDVVFVPTVLVHHLLGWRFLIKRGLFGKQTRVILFFPNAPIVIDPDTQEAEWHPAASTRLFVRLIHSLRDEIEQGHVIIGVETQPMRAALSKLTGTVVTYFPHTVEAETCDRASSPELSKPHLTMACYGSARHEKGSDTLALAMERYLTEFPNGHEKFVIQWLKDFVRPDGSRATLPEVLKSHPRVTIIDHFFADGEYSEWLAKTDVMLLPYRLSSYALRVSRVAIEAMQAGIPVVATRGTTLLSQAQEYGAAVPCDEDSADGIVAAIRFTTQNFKDLRRLATERVPYARKRFSVEAFREVLLSESTSTRAGS